MKEIIRRLLHKPFLYKLELTADQMQDLYGMVTMAKCFIVNDSNVYGWGFRDTGDIEKNKMIEDAETEMRQLAMKTHKEIEDLILATRDQ